MKKLAVILLVALLLASCGQQQQQQQVVVVQQQQQVVVVPAVPQPGYASWCTGLPSSRLSAGMYVHVSNYPDLRNRLRTGPSHNREIVGMAPVGTEMYLLDGPYCDSGWYIYWHVQIIDKNMVEDRTVPKSQLNSVYTAETDTSGTPWLIP